MKPLDRVVVYGSLGLRRGISDLLWAFRKSSRLEEFPAYLDDHPFQVISRVEEESKSHIRTADVVIMPHYAVLSMAKAGLLAKYSPSAGQSFHKNVRTSDGLSTPVGVTFMAMAYLRGRLSKADLPSDVSGLAKKSWGGKLGAQSFTSSRSGNLGAWYMSFLQSTVERNDWEGVLEALAGANRPHTFDCIDHLLQGLLEGEVKLALTVYSLAYFREKSGGSPVALVDQERIPHMMTFTTAGLVRGAEENPAAKRFLDFLLTPVAQDIIGSIPGIAPLEAPTNYDFEHDFGSKTLFHPSPEDLTRMENDMAEFRRAGLP